MRARVVAPLVAAVLGIAGGVTTALVAPADDGERAASSYNDPLHLGVPLVDQDCSGDSLLVLGYGDTVAPLANAVANSGGKDVRYLRSDESCPTTLGPEGKPAATYVVYRGPYDSRSEPCGIRMAGDASGAFVTVLRSGNEQLVKCPCEVPLTEAPDLQLGMVADQHDVIWIRALQAMLHDVDPEGFPHEAVTGVYDETTAAVVTELQADSPGRLTTPGVVDESTWGLLTDRICRTYTY